MQRVDRELFLELIEYPVNPTFLHMSTPLKGYHPMFYLQINGEALWQWHVVKKQKQMFEVLQDNSLQLGYRLSSSCKDRVGVLIYSNTLRQDYISRYMSVKAGFHMIADDRRRSRIANRRSQTIAKRVVSI